MSNLIKTRNFAKFWPFLSDQMQCYQLKLSRDHNVKCWPSLT